MPALTFQQARAVITEKIAELAQEPSREIVPLDDALGRVLASVVTADRDYPPFNRSARDGFAVRASDVANPPARMRVIGQTRAGEPSKFQLQPGETVEIMTGAPGPEGADTVVMWEHSTRDGDHVTLEKSMPAGKNLIFRGNEAKQGSVVLEPGVRLDYPEIALLVSTGNSSVEVYRKPTVAILSTGDEVVELDVAPESFQIRNSNAYSLAMQVRRQGGEPRILPIAPDRLDRTRELVEEGLKSDLLLLSGGVSMGKYDFVAQVLGELGAEFYFTEVKIQPGKPLLFGRVGSTPVFGLPGNPISTMVTFEVFARIALHRLAGRTSSPLPFLEARLGSNFNHKPVLTRFLPSVLQGDYTEATVDPVKWQGSGDLVALARANCFLVATPDRESWKAGETIFVLPR
jgi:molybdopterin molybdotransferase